MLNCLRSALPLNTYMSATCRPHKEPKKIANLTGTLTLTLLLLTLGASCLHFRIKMKRIERQAPTFTHNEAFDNRAENTNPTYDEIDQVQTNAHYDQVSGALTFQASGGLSTTTYADGSNSVA